MTLPISYLRTRIVRLLDNLASEIEKCLNDNAKIYDTANVFPLIRASSTYLILKINSVVLIGGSRLKEGRI